jgi:hypothetical protein
MHVYPENPWPAAKTVPTETPILGAIVRQEAPENRSDADRIEKRWRSQTSVTTLALTAAASILIFGKLFDPLKK